MRKFTSFATLAMLLAFSAGADAQESNPAADSSPNLEAGAAAATTTKAEDNQWRYKWHNGQWWYWMPGKYWVYRENDRWVVYDARSYRSPRQIASYQVGGGSRNYGRNYSYDMGGSIGGFSSDFDAGDAIDFADDVGSAFGSAFGIPW
jgi:hypothetical protein